MCHTSKVWLIYLNKEGLQMNYRPSLFYIAFFVKPVANYDMGPSFLPSGLGIKILRLSLNLPVL